MRLIPHLDALSDPKGLFTPEQVTSAAFIRSFAPLALRDVNANSGATWLRVRLEADKGGRLAQEGLYPVMDMGGAQPGPVTLFVPQYDDDAAAWPTGWKEFSSDGSKLLPLPAPQSGSIVCYIRIPGPPTPWFHPTLHMRKAAEPVREEPFMRTTVVQGVMAGLILLNFLLMAMGRGESRFWLALYGALGLIHSIAGPAPAPAGGLPFSAAWSILTPGLALVLLPHVGRHILGTWKNSPGNDEIFRALSLLGALLVVLPLIPGCGSLVRLLPLWPLLALLAAFPAISCSLQPVPGAKRFLLACLITASGAVLSLLPADSPDQARLASLLPLCGVAAGLLLLTPLVGIPRVRESGKPLPLFAAPAFSELDDLPPVLQGIPATAATPQSAPASAAAAKAPALLGQSTPKQAMPAAVVPNVLTTPTKPSKHVPPSNSNGSSVTTDTTVPAARPMRAAQNAHTAQPSAPAASPGREQLRQEAIRELLARVSHDLRTPLNTILHVAENLTLSALNHTGHEQLRTLQAAAGNLSTLVNDLLDLNRADKGRLRLRHKPFDLQRLLIETHDIILPQAEQKGLSLIWYMAPHLGIRYSGDADRLMQILLNILGNAIRFSDKGTVSIRVTRVPDSANPGHLLFRIRDNGISIPLQNQYDVLGEFCLDPGTGTGRYGATGLGLPIARDLIGLMGGCICLDSRPNQGTEVSFSVRLSPLPGDMVAPAPGRLMSAVNEEDEAHPFAKPPKQFENHLLVADDVASNRQLVRFFLEGLPLVMIEARTGEEAAALYTAHPCGVVMVDADMPGMGGPRTVKAIREFESRNGLDAVPILALTSRPEESGSMHEAGCTATLPKPISRTRLLEMLTRLVPPHILRRTAQASAAHDAETETETGNAAPQSAEHHIQPSPSHATQPERTRSGSAYAPGHPHTPGPVHPHTHDSSARGVAHTAGQQMPYSAFGGNGASETPVSSETSGTSETQEAAAARFNPPSYAPPLLLNTSASPEQQGAPMIQASEAAIPPAASAPAPTPEGTSPAALVPNLDTSLIPLIPGLLESIASALNDAHRHASAANTFGVQEATGRIGGSAASFGLRALERMARCVERAATADDLEAVTTLLPDLENMVSRNSRALADIHRMHQTMTKH
ncbi:hypothetical protein DSM19430T_12580 [Desulfovibrio psychrotolerans]|uniref:histidine kinase n=1 Tax=Desulfovibrio psychrotolerans TaxID=415242 RepID=A0A7J0BUA1_9BACT|nr:hypothetical protein DSM19430T_12580 [Desulfovibrio psychrotolerans]